jgi:polyphenol oxidase
MFKEIRQNGVLWGHQFQFEYGFAFFGSKHASMDDIKGLFPRLTFTRLKQIHSDRIVQSNLDSQSEPVEADGHWTDRRGHALVIQTADCLPAMIYSAQRVIALHAGWRGVEQQIISKALQLPFTVEFESMIVGPSIDTKSFEVGTDVAKRLLNSDPLKDFSSIIDHPDREKKYVDLKKIARHQANSIRPNLTCHFINANTYESPDHFSYRRNGPQAGRLFSFIALT